MHIPVSQHPFPDVANIAIFYHFAIELRLPFPAAAIDRECEKRHISQQEYLDSHGIAKHQYYRWKRRYREEDEQSLVPAGFVPMMPGAVPAQSAPAQKSKGKQQKLQDQESFLTVEIRTSCGSAMRIQGNMTAAHLREIISASNV